MTAMDTYLLLALIGTGGGLISGAVGLAGGIFIVPALVALLGTPAMGEAIVGRQPFNQLDVRRAAAVGELKH